MKEDFEGVYEDLYVNDDFSYYGLCEECGMPITIDNVVFSGNRKDTPHRICRECFNAKQRKYNNNLKLKKQNLIDIYLAGGCRCCGEERKECLEFHHIDPKTKEANISELVNSPYSIDKLKHELLKCTVLCANCHRSFHFQNKMTGINLVDFIKKFHAHIKDVHVQENL